MIGDYDAIVVRSATKLTAELIERGTNLKVIGRAGVGVDNVDVDAATRRGIVVANAPESNVVSAAEHTIGLLLALARNIPQAHAALREGRWERSHWGGVELADKMLGVLGFGRIGRQVARRALGLEMKVVAYDPFVSGRALPRARRRARGVRRGARARGVPDAAPAAHRRHAERDRRGHDREDARRRPDRQRRPRRADRRRRARRRARVGEGRRCRDRRLLDEPYAGPLLHAPNVVVTPHLAASTEEAQDRAGVVVAEQVVAALEGGLVTNAVNIPTIGAEDLEVLGPFVPLAAKLGRLAMELAGGETRRIGIEVYGELAEYDTRLLTVAALNGAFQGQTDQPVNYVNAPIVAADRGIEVVEEKRRAARDYTNLVAVTADGVRVAGTTIGKESRHLLVHALGFAARDGVRAAHGAPSVRRRAGCDRAGRDAVRRRPA